MTRRRFLALSAGTLAGVCTGGLAGCARWPHASTVPASMDAASFHAARRYTRTAFGRIAHVERGSGPAALFLHGFPLNGFQWRGALDRLAPYRRCIAPALARSHAPVRIVWGSADTIFSAENPGFLDRAFGRSLGVRQLQGSKLFWPEERPDVIAEEARRLWAALGDEA